MKYLVTERQVVEYTWEVDGDKVEDLDAALEAIDGVPEGATSRLISSETSHLALPATGPWAVE